jgi:predicted Ser/Thr protein kinase
MCGDCALDSVDTSEGYLNLAKQCMERVQKMISLSASTVKFNHGQCRYLAEKLNMAVQYACSALEALNNERVWPQKDVVDCLEAFKLLYALAMEVENIIQSCCRNAWTLAAVSLTDVSEHISSIGFNLELWRVAFYQRKTRADIDNIFQAEVEVVNEHASGDKETLLRDIHALLQRRNMSITEYERASLLLERLERSRLTPTGESARLPQSSRSEFVMSSLIQMESLGKGSASTVYRATWLGAEFAKKTFYGPNFPDFEKEVSILTGLSHPYIAPLIWHGKDKRECSIVMELMDGDLFTLMQRRLKGDKARDSPFGILEAVDIMHQIGEGMHFLHEMKIVHRDLKSMNVLVKCVKSSNSKVEYVQVKVADFGMSRTKERSTTYSNQTMNVGTTRWMAPEIIRCFDSRSQGNGEGLVVQYPFKCDVYSFGMVCYEILSGDIPFSNIYSPSEVKKMVLDGGHPELPNECPELLKNLIRRCWSLDASQRPKFGDICVDLRHLKYLLLSMPCKYLFVIICCLFHISTIVLIAMQL